MTIHYKQVEYHTVHVHKDMVVAESDIVEVGLTVERFKEIMCGEEHTDEESDAFYEVIHGYAEVVESEEDWFSERKGGYEVDYELLEDED